MRLATLAGTAAAVLAAVSTGAGCGDGAGDGSDVIDELPAVELAPLTGDGAAVDLAGLSGPAVINLWATWCAPCRRELPAFQQVSEQRADVAFIGVDVGTDPEASRQFLSRLDVSFPQYRDQDARLTDALGVASLPVTLFVGADGAVQTHLGPISTGELMASLDRLT